MSPFIFSFEGAQNDARRTTHRVGLWLFLWYHLTRGFARFAQALGAVESITARC
jgi:hypothetical protein